VPIEPFGSHFPRIAANAFVHSMATVIGDVSIGEESTVWPAVVIRGDDGFIRIGDLTSIQDGSVIHNTEGLSTTSIGNRVTVGHKVTLHGCTIEDDCLIGMGAIILDNAVIGTGSLIGAATFIPAGKVIPPRSLVYGNPYRIVREVGERETAMIDNGWRAYQERAKQYLAREKSAG